MRGWREPPIVFQILALLLGGLIVAQLVTLLLTLVLPPAPPAEHRFQDIVAALAGRDARHARLRRRLEAAPPKIGGPGWFVSDPARRQLAAALGLRPDEVRLAFYAPLPLNGITPLPEPMPEMRPIRWMTAPEPLPAPDTPLQRIALLADAGPGGGRRGPGPGFGGWGWPGGDGWRRGGFGPLDPGLPARAADPARSERPAPAAAPSPADLDRQPVNPDGGQANAAAPAPPAAPAPAPAAANRSDPAPAPAATANAAPPPHRTPSPAPLDATPLPMPFVASPAPAGPSPAAPPAPALFGLAPAPFVGGDFIAAARLRDGRWAVVQPEPQGFPNAWQRRVILWFLIAFALVAPLGWLFARRIVRPLARFTSAAEQLGRDPSAATTLTLDGPAELGRAARAFTLMHTRLRSFVDDRTAMVGAISHDLRTPLTRLRFRIEDIEDEAAREGMSQEIAEMEAMIASVLAFVRDASTPNLRERLDLAVLVEDVAQDAALIGGDVRIEEASAAPVEVDVLGMRRLLANLVENAVKYGQRARIRLHVEEGSAVAEIGDDGPGLPDEEMERVFEPFYRAANADESGKTGSGLGLAVCRSIARAHGGDVRLVRSARGFAAQLRLPLAFAPRPG
ncbi:ATP-binding protein [Sphingomonas morindae]|uniref:histidine kinase n=1 Tax=Sphingomonas morindae TaxID=1541170 RepID=A0ABY4XCL6_9SPHN|nr:ATP-binding protein [Sphingomonas morindae]USI74579.1 HAMP domain-containing protein [Sphingomonas morindae]